MGRVADQHNILVIPLGITHANETDPGRGGEMSRIAHELMPAQPLRKQRLTGSDSLLGVHLVQAGTAPRILIAFHDERGGVSVKAVTMRLKNAILVLDKV